MPFQVAGRVPSHGDFKGSIPCDGMAAPFTIPRRHPSEASKNQKRRCENDGVTSGNFVDAHRTGGAIAERGLAVTEGLDGAEAGGLQGGEQAGEDADGGGEGDGKDLRLHGDDGGVAGG